MAFMKRALFLLIPVLLPAVALAADEAPKRSVLKELQTNRAMLARFESEYALLKQLENDKSTEVRRELSGLKYKIEALRQETERLSASLDESQQADEFMKDVVAQTTMSGASVAPPGEERPTQSLHERALKLVEQKKFEEAATVYEEILLADPDDDQAYLILGHVRLLMGDVPKAQQAFMNAVAIDPDDVDEIVPFYENLTVQNPGDDVAQSNLGYACLIVGDLVRAKEAFRTALSLQPSNEPALKGLEIAEESA
jgi:tetratricopeptide (TPR) repeat protein